MSYYLLRSNMRHQFDCIEAHSLQGEYAKLSNT
jgi:hypothetical protein